MIYKFMAAVVLVFSIILIGLGVYAFFIPGAAFERIFTGVLAIGAGIFFAILQIGELKK